MRILFLASELCHLGGIQYAGRLLLRALRDCLGDRAEVTVLSLRDAKPKLEGLVEGEACGMAGDRVRMLWHVLGLGLRRRWDLLVLGHIHLAALAPLLGPSCRRSLGIVYGVEAWQALRGTRRMGMRRVGRYLYISAHTRARAVAANPWLADIPGDVCHLGLLPGPAPQDAPGDEPFALGIGRMSAAERYKGFEELIRIWPGVRQERPGLRLVFIGDGDDRPRLQALAAPQGDDVRFLGAVDDRERDRLLGRCRCFCLPARGEGLGLVYLEAMRLGKPVLAGIQDAGREVVVDGATGRTADPLDAGQLLQGVLDVSGPRAASMGEAGRRRFQECYTYEAFLKRFDPVLRKALP
jgi:phosphatidylinositol alpha-1,6-mannosyltransferase